MSKKEELDERDRAVAAKVRQAAIAGASVPDLFRLVQKEYGHPRVRAAAMVAFRDAFGLNLETVRVIADWSGWEDPGPLDDDAISAELAPKVQAALTAQK